MVNRVKQVLAKARCPRRKFILSIILLTTALFIIACTPSGPPKITISPLTITPSNAVPGQPVSIAVNVLSSENKPVADYQVSLKINDAVVETQQVEINAGETRTITFQYTPPAPGNYRAEINGETAVFDALRPANFVVGQVDYTPESPTVGQEIKLSADVKNDGELPGTYTAVFKLDGQVLATTELQIGAGQSVTAAASFLANTSGIHVVELGAATRNIKVIKPAEFKATSISITPDSVLVGDVAEVTVIVANTGEVAGTLPVPLIVNGVASSSQEVTLEPGASQTVDFSLSQDTGGTYNISVLGSSTTLSVTALKEYTGAFYYKISYPPDFTINDDDPYRVAIGKQETAFVGIMTQRVAVASTPRDYFDRNAAEGKQASPDWTYSSLIEIKENGITTGYAFDFSFTSNGLELVGKAKAIKKGGLGFFVAFTTVEPEWADNEALATRCLDSFVPPVIATGAYTSPETGVSLTLPAEWSAIDTGSTQTPLLLFAPGDTGMLASMASEIVGQDVTAQQYATNIIPQLTDVGFRVTSQSAFQFADLSSGYEVILTGTSAGEQFKFRIFCVASGTRMYSLVFGGSPGDMDAQAGGITQMVKSFTVTEPGMAGIDKNETLFLLEGEVPTLDPALTEEAPAGIAGAVFSGLVRLGSDLEIAPDLAERWSVSADGKTYTFYLRHNAKFHSGRLVTAADVKYSWERACDPALKSPKAGYFLNDIVGAQDKLDGKVASISGIKVIDDFTLEVTIDTPKQYFLQKLAQVVAYVVDKDNVAAGATWYEEPNGTGPFTLKTWVKDNYIVLERFDDFYTGPVRLKNIVFKMFAGDPMQLYENGEIDITGVGTSELDRVLDTSNALNKELLTGADANIYYVGLNVTKPPFDDPKVREAFGLALDVDKLIEVSLKGQAERAAGYLSQAIPGFDSSLQPLPFDVARAKQLIGESKYGSVAGLPQITVYELYGIGSFDQAVIGMWQQNLGVQVRVETISELATYFERLRNKEFQVIIFGWWADFIDPQNFLEVLFQSASTENNFAYSNPEVDAALALAAAETDEATRLQMYRDIEKQVLADLPAIPLYRDSLSYVLVKPYVKGFVVTPVAAINLWRDIYVVAH